MTPIWSNVNIWMFDKCADYIKSPSFGLIFYIAKLAFSIFWFNILQSPNRVNNIKNLRKYYFIYVCFQSFEGRLIFFG